MVRIDKNRVQQLEKELKDLAVPNHQYKIWVLKEDLTKEQLIALEKLLVKEHKKTRREEHKWSKELKKALNSLYPWLHPCCLLRNVKVKIGMIEAQQKSPNNNQAELARYLNQTLDNQNKKKEEKIAEIFDFCLDYLNQGVKEDWKKRRNKTQMLLTLAENEWKNTKREAFKEIVNEGIIEKIKF